MKAILILLKRDKVTAEISRQQVDITNLTEWLDPMELFLIEFAINQGVPGIRAHISLLPDVNNADNVGQEGELPRN